jgi:hypothetical protein
MDPINLKIDATNADQKRYAIRVLSEAQRLISTLKNGFHRLEVSLIRFHPRRSELQNNWYWGSFVTPFGSYLRVNNPKFTNEMAHEVLRKMFLEESIFNERTGKVYTYVKSTTNLTTVEFCEYLEKCGAMLMTECGISVPDPSVYRKHMDKNAA